VTPNASDNEAGLHSQQQVALGENCVTANWYRQSKNVINITIQYPQANDQKRTGASFDFNII